MVDRMDYRQNVKGRCTVGARTIRGISSGMHGALVGSIATQRDE
jgi:hypothetical protein